MNPLKPFALDEIARCARDPSLQCGIKIHFGNSDVRLDDEVHVEQLQRVFRAANDRGMAIVVDLRPAGANGESSSVAQARVFLERLLPDAPDVPVQLSQMAGGGSAYDASTDSAVAFLADTVAARDPRTARRWFDVTSLVTTVLSPATATQVARRIRQIGVDRIVFGSDLMRADESPCGRWSDFLRLPLSVAEFRAIATNVVPYLPRISRLSL